MKKLKHSEAIVLAAKRSGLSRQNVRKVAKALIGVWADHLGAGEVVIVPGFGVFRSGVVATSNPVIQKLARVPRVGMTAAKRLKKRIQDVDKRNLEKINGQ